CGEVTSAIDADARDAERRPVREVPRAEEEVVELLPNRVLPWVSHKDPVLDPPRLLAEAPADDLGRKVRVLYVDGRGEYEHVVRKLGVVVLAPTRKDHLVVERVLVLFPRIAELQVDELHEPLTAPRLSRLDEFGHERAELNPRRIEAREVEASDRGYRGRNPLPGGEQVGIDAARAANHAGAVRALVARRVGKMLAGIAPIPLHLRPNEALERAAARAWHVKEALVRTLEPRLDLRLPFD